MKDLIEFFYDDYEKLTPIEKTLSDEIYEI